MNNTDDIIMLEETVVRDVIIQKTDLKKNKVNELINKMKEKQKTLNDSFEDFTDRVM